VAHKSVVLNLSVTTAAKGHNCRHNKSHRIGKGARRLTIKVERNQHHYCLTCAKIILEKGILKLQHIQTEVESI